MPLSWVSRRFCKLKSAKRIQPTPFPYHHHHHHHLLLLLSASTSPVPTPHEAPTATTLTPPLPLTLLLLLLLLPDQGPFPLQLLFGLLDPDLRTGEVLRPPGMSIHAGLAVRTKPSQVVLTQAPTNMPLGTQGSQLAESPVVVFTGGQTRLLPHVLIQAVVAIGTVAGPREGLAFRHAAEVVFMKVLALETLFAESLEEMLADQRPMCG